VQGRSRIDPHLRHRLDEFNATDRARLERMATRLGSLGANAVEPLIAYGFPAPIILEQAERHSLAVMGSQGRAFVKGVFLGSVSQNVLRRAPTAALVVPPVRRDPRKTD
jgi:nucleotide-binding universal stress UspA family protein